MKRTALKRKSKSPRKKLEDKIWDHCKRIIRARYGDTCYTCGAGGLYGINWQTGHGKPKGALSLRFKYDLRNLRPQCMRDNIHLGGLSDIFIARLEREKDGKEFLEEACYKEEGQWKIKHIPPMGTMEAGTFLEELIEQYAKFKK